MHIVDTELEQLSVSYKPLIEDHKRKLETAEQAAKALAVKEKAAKTTEGAEGAVTQPTATETDAVNTVNISPPPGSITNVF